MPAAEVNLARSVSALRTNTLHYARCRYRKQSPSVISLRASRLCLNRPGRLPKRKQRTETATGFKRRSGWATVGYTSCIGHGNRCASSRRWLGLTAETHTRSKSQLARKRRIHELRPFLNGMNAQGNGAVQMPREGGSRRWVGSNFRFARDTPGAAHFSGNAVSRELSAVRIGFQEPTKR
jgi:hypothetical protein